MVSNINKWMTDDYVGLINGREGVVLLGMESLTVEEAQTLRNEVRATGAELRVTKNRIAKVALTEAGVEIDDSAWQGTCGLLVGDTEATISAAKAVEKLWKKADPRKVTWRAAFLDGSTMDAAEAARIPDMPDKQTLRAMMCGALLATGVSWRPSSTRSRHPPPVRSRRGRTKEAPSRAFHQVPTYAFPRTRTEPCPKKPPPLSSTTSSKPSSLSSTPCRSARPPRWSRRWKTAGA